MGSESIQQPAESPPAKAKEYELGVLFIHGIGEQKRGQTLLAFGEPLCRWLDTWTKGSVQVSHAVLGSDPNDRIAPAHVHVSIAAWSQKRTCLLAESCWAETFPTPSFGDVARWVLLALPWTLAAQFALRFRPAMGEAGGLLRHYPRFALDTVSSVITFLLGACVQILVAALLILAVIPIKRLRDFLLRLQARIAGIIGDSYALLDSPIRSSAILEKVRNDLAWLVRRSDRVAIVAHSQGAAIAHKLIEMLESEKSDRERGNREKSDPASKAIESNEDLLAAIDLYFSFGSGLGKLRDIQAAFRAGGATLLFGFVFMLCVLVTAGFVPLALLAAPGPNLLVIFVSLLATVGFFVIVVFVSLGPDRDRRALELRCFRRRDSTGDDGQTRADSGTIRWVDRYATSDPVPSGPLFLGEAQRMDSQPVHNGASVLFDHVTYWQNSDEFVRDLVAELGPPLDLALAREQLPFRQAVARRRWRIRWLSAFRILGFASLIVLLWGLWDHLVPAGEAMLTTARAVVPVGEGQLSELPRTLGAAGVVGLAMLWFLVTVAAYQRWEARDFRRTSKQKRLDEGGLPFLAFVSAGVAFPVMVLALALLRFDVERVLSALLVMWGARESIGFGSVVLPLWSAFAAFPTWWLATRADDRNPGSEHSLRGETFMQAWLATALGSFAIIVWVGVNFPRALTRLPPDANLLEQLIQALALWGPYLVAGGLVALWFRTAGPRLAGWLAARSVHVPRREEEKATPWSVEAMGVIALACGATSVLLRWLAARFELVEWALVVLMPLWFVAGLAAANALTREMEADSGYHWKGAGESLGSSLGGAGLLLASLSLMWNVASQK